MNGKNTREDNSDEELVLKRLNKIIIAIFMAMNLLLAIIIIVEFKEYSNDYREYKIGIPELGPKDLVWAGIMGSPPRYYDSDEKYGQGYKEIETKEIRKALKEAGFNLVYRYMSPNRLEFEFERKHPICFYDRQWSNPVEYFSKKRHPILSLPLEFSGRVKKKIFFRKGERHKFEKHLDEKGNLKLESLFQDKSLKTELVRKVNYSGPFAMENITYGKKQLDGTYYDFVKEEYAKNIDLAILHTNDQLLNMLERKRFDYQFYDSLEYDDYQWTKKGFNGIETLIFDEKMVNGIDDPNLIFHSVACGNHPLAKKAMPIMNEVIVAIRRNLERYTKIGQYYKILDPKTTRSTPNYSLIAGWNLGVSLEESNHWYEYQFKNRKITPWPMFTVTSKLRNDFLEKITIKNKMKDRPLWYMAEKINVLGEKILLIINETDIKSEKDKNLLLTELSEYPFEEGKTKFIDKKHHFNELHFSKTIESNYSKLIIFARGINNKEFDLLTPLYSKNNNNKLKSIILVESTQQQTGKVLQNLPIDLEQLIFYDSQFLNIPIGEVINKMKFLKDLSIFANINERLPLWIRTKELLSIMNGLPETLESLRIVGANNYFSNWFPLKAAQIFAKKKLKRLKRLNLSNFPLDNQQINLILKSLPLDIESLTLGYYTRSLYSTTDTKSMISSFLLGDFLNRRYQLNKLKTLEIYGMIFSLDEGNTLPFPSSLESLTIADSRNLNDKNFHRLIFAPHTKLKKINLAGNTLSDFTLNKIFAYMDKRVNEINLCRNVISGDMFSFIKQQYPAKIKKLLLGQNPINNRGMIDFSKLNIDIQELDISNTKITDNAINFLNLMNIPNLESINLSGNQLSHDAINIFLKKYYKNIKKINLSYVISLDVNTLSTFLSPHLESLDLRGMLLSDEEIIILAKKLPKNLHYLDISGSRMGHAGAYTLANNMPKLVEFYFDFKFGHSEKGLKYLFENLSPYLTRLNISNNTLSLNNVNLLLNSIPKYLFELKLGDFETEECKILFSKLPDALRILDWSGNIKSKGHTLEELFKNFPTHLSKIEWGYGVSENEQDSFLQKVFEKYFLGIVTERRTSFTSTLLKYSSLFRLTITGTSYSKNFKDVIFPPDVRFIGNHKFDIPKGFLNSLEPAQLENLKFLTMNKSTLDPVELLNFLKKLPPHIFNLSLKGVNMQLEDIDKIIEVLPENLTDLIIQDNPFGEEGLKKFRAFKAKMEAKTGLPFRLVE